MHHASETQSPVGEAFFAAVNDVEMLEVSPLEVAADAVLQYSAERPSSVPTRLSSSRVLEQRLSLSSVVTTAEVSLLSSLKEASRLLTTPSMAASAAPVRQRLNVREKLYSDHTAAPLADVRDRSPVRQLSRTPPHSSGMLTQNQAAKPDIGPSRSPAVPSIMLEVPGGVHAVTAMPAAVIERVGVQVHWGEDVCEGSSPPPKRLSGGVRDVSAVGVEPPSSEDDYGESSFRASLFGTET